MIFFSIFKRYINRLLKLKMAGPNRDLSLQVLKWQILVFIFSIPMALGSERTSTDPVFWSDFYTFLKATPAEMQRYSSEIPLADSEFKIIKHKNTYNIYRISSHHYHSLKKSRATIIESPPFSLVDPQLPWRKKQNDLQIWMTGYKDYELINKILFRLERLFPDYAKVYQIGKSHKGRIIYALKISDHPALDENEASFLFNSAHHGNEVLSIEYSLDLAYFLLFGQSAHDSRSGFLQSLVNKLYKKSNAQGTVHYRSGNIQSWLDELEIWIVPVVNPDGLERFWNYDTWAGRKNDRDTWSRGSWQIYDGVDLNRNYPFYWNSDVPNASSGDPKSPFYRGTKAASEPETRAMMRLADQERFVISFSFHTYATKILTPYTITNSLSPHPNPGWLFAEKLINVMKSFRRDGPYKTQRNLYPVDGTDQDWLFNQFGTMAFIVEGSYHSPRYEPEGRKSIQGMRPAAKYALEMYQSGPVIVIQTINQLGQPLGDVSVKLDHVQFFENENHTTHKKTGRYDFILENSGTYTVLAQKKGYRKTTKKINCYFGHCTVRIGLTPE